MQSSTIGRNNISAPAIANRRNGTNFVVIFNCDRSIGRLGEWVCASQCHARSQLSFYWMLVLEGLVNIIKESPADLLANRPITVFVLNINNAKDNGSLQTQAPPSIIRMTNNIQVGYITTNQRWFYSQMTSFEISDRWQTVVVVCGKQLLFSLYPPYIHIQQRAALAMARNKLLWLYSASRNWDMPPRLSIRFAMTHFWSK